MIRFFEPQLDFMGIGTSCIVSRVQDGLVLKYALEEFSPLVASEYAVLDELEKQPFPAVLCRSILRIGRANFVEGMKETLHRRLVQHEICYPDNPHRVMDVAELLPRSLVCRWTEQLSAALAWLEQMGYAHGDLNLSNILLDDNDDLKLSDFDNTVKLGTQLGVCQAFSRRDADGSCGIAGALCTQFEVGSIIYQMVNGHEPYVKDWFEPDHGHACVDKQINRECPPVADNDIGKIISRCWNGEFESIAALHAATIELHPEMRRPSHLTTERVEELRDICRGLLAEGITQKAAADARSFFGSMYHEEDGPEYTGATWKPLILPPPAEPVENITVSG
ncbi:hypothetical protein ANO11243_029840 [Dothideomycetidae sp. 11243]|nr:hypothetical protein ANO11243_029840 [fungal sp. No.11243]